MRPIMELAILAVKWLGVVPIQTLISILLLFLIGRDPFFGSKSFILQYYCQNNVYYHQKYFWYNLLFQIFVKN